MEKLKLYVITKSSTDEIFKIGDIIWLSENGDLNNATAQGWLLNNEWINKEIISCTIYCA